MNSLRVLEKELVPVYETDKGEKVVYGTELHAVLNVRSRFNDWIKNRLNDCDAVENMDFQTLTKNLVGGGKQKEYIIKLDTAKEMAMLERNEKGKQVRRYFIQVEKKYKEQKQIKSPLQLLELEFAAIKEVDSRIEAVNKDLQQFKSDIPIFSLEESRIKTAVRRKAVSCLGGKASAAYNDTSLRAELYYDIYQQIHRQFGVSTCKAIKRSQCDIVIGMIKEYEPPYVLSRKIQDCNA